MSIQFPSTSAQNNLVNTRSARALRDERDDDNVSGKYSQLDIGDFEESLFSNKIQDEHTIFSSLHNNSANNNDYIDPMSDPTYSKFANNMKGLISSVSDPEMQAIFAEQMEAASKAASDRLIYQATKKPN